MQGKIQKEYVRTCFKPQRQRSLVISIYDPAIRLQNRLQFLIELLAGNRCPVRFMKDSVQIPGGRRKLLPVDSFALRALNQAVQLAFCLFPWVSALGSPERKVPVCPVC